MTTLETAESSSATAPLPSPNTTVRARTEGASATSARSQDGRPAKAEDKGPRIRRTMTAEQICVLTFDRPASAANIFDLATLNELHEHLNAIEKDSDVRGLVLASAKKSIFVAGADLHSLSQGVDEQGLRHVAELGQSAFNRIAALRIRTVAAIHGACVGGGYEICLACNYRVASTDKATKIGLPETQLGILPAWGGTTRLPRLIGLPKALDIILNGKTLAAKPALKVGMVDELVPKEYILEIACQRAGQGRVRRSTKWLQNNGMVAAGLRKYLRPRLLRKTRAHYPAILKALEIATEGVSLTLPGSLALERQALVELAQTETCRNLIRVFFLQERAKKLSAGGEANASKAPAMRNVSVIGAGIMGAGIAQWCSARQMKVILRDINAEQVGKGMASIAQLYGQGVKRHTFTKVEARAGLDRIFPTASDVPLRNVDLVIEAAVEKMPLKKQIFKRLDELAGAQTILATNTSALSISELAGAVKHPERVIGIHFFNPVHRMQLVEVVTSRQTSAETLQRSIRFVQQIGKLPVVVKDSPGFLVNRILMPYLIEAGHLFETGGRVENIDEAMLEFGMPMGPLRLIDEVGVDVAGHVADTIAACFSARLRVPEVLSKMLKDGMLGRKSGQGFYHYGGRGKEPTVSAQIDEFHRDTISASLGREELRSRMVLLMVNEAARCLEEGIVGEAADVDFAMIMGTGFAPFRGGPLRFADSSGIANVVSQMQELAAKGEGRFAPCALLQSMAEQAKLFYP
jgi:3-hydroxyacyl-CoA dehydrogenase/enoyl-CoA hydratase/3-hydroxybutyryl-CoA epimerase